MSLGVTVTCQQAPGHLGAERTWSLARTHERDSQHPDFYPCEVHEPAGLQSAEALRIQQMLKNTVTFYSIKNE